MSIDIQKPEPLMVGDKAYYTLTSYDPIKVSVRVPYASDRDVALAMQSLISHMGGTLDDYKDATWRKAHFGTEDADEIHQQVFEQLQKANAETAEQQKVAKVLQALVGRLKQRIPQAHVLRARDALRGELEHTLAKQNITLDTFLLQNQMSESDLAAYLDAEALGSAEQSAALDAFARERKLQVNDDEIAGLLGVPDEQGKELLDGARRAGQLEDLRDAALRSKAAAAVVAEADCTYEHETPEEAEERFNNFMDRLQKEMGAAGVGDVADLKNPQSHDDGPSKPDKNSRFKLV